MITLESLLAEITEHLDTYDVRPDMKRPLAAVLASLFEEALDQQTQFLQNRINQLAKLCNPCPICSERPADTLHHLIPQNLGAGKDKPEMLGRRKILICFECHQALHVLLSNKQMAANYLTLDAYLQDVDLMAKTRVVADKIRLRMIRYQPNKDLCPAP